MALQAQAVLECPCDAIADVGYYHGEEVKTCLAAGITPTCPVRSPQPTRSSGSSASSWRSIRLGRCKGGENRLLLDARLGEGALREELDGGGLSSLANACV